MLLTPSLRPNSTTGTKAPVVQRPSRPASAVILNSGASATKVSSGYRLIADKQRCSTGQARGIRSRFYLASGSSDREPSTGQALGICLASVDQHLRVISTEKTR